MTAQGLHLLRSGEVESGGGEMPGVVAPWPFSPPPQPDRPVIGGAAKLYGEGTGSDTIEGAAERTADEISAQLRKAAEDQGWIQSRAPCGALPERAHRNGPKGLFAGVGRSDKQAQTPAFCAIWAGTWVPKRTSRPGG